MKKIISTLVALFATSTLLMAGGDLAPVEQVQEAEETTPFYVGIGYGYGMIQAEDRFDEVFIQAGYSFNDFIAVEGRYWFGVNTEFLPAEIAGENDGFNAGAIYLKPQYSVTPEFKVYALLGYGWADINIANDNGFSYGAGASYEVFGNIDLFVDYTAIVSHDLSNRADVDSYNVGISYKF